MFLSLLAASFMVLTATVFAAFARAMLQALYAVGWGGGGMFIKAQGKHNLSFHVDRPVKF